MSEDLARRIRANQQTLTANLKQHYDFIICGSGSSGSVMARRLAERRGVDLRTVSGSGPAGRITAEDVEAAAAGDAAAPAAPDPSSGLATTARARR